MNKFLDFLKYISESLMQCSKMNSRFKVSSISQFSHSPIHIGPSIQTAENSRDMINGGEYRIKVQVHDKEHLNEINSNLDFLKERNSSLKKAIENRLIEINKAQQMKYRRASMPTYCQSQETIKPFMQWKYGGVKPQHPGIVCKAFLALALVMVAFFCAVTIMDGIGIKLSSDIKNVSNEIEDTASGMLKFQREVELFMREFNKTTKPPSTTTISSPTIHSTSETITIGPTKTPTIQTTTIGSTIASTSWTGNCRC